MTVERKRRILQREECAESQTGNQACGSCGSYGCGGRLMHRLSTLASSRSVWIWKYRGARYRGIFLEVLFLPLFIYMPVVERWSSLMMMLGASSAGLAKPAPCSSGPISIRDRTLRICMYEERMIQISIKVCSLVVEDTWRMCLKCILRTQVEMAVSP